MTVPGADIHDFILDCRYLNYYAISRCAVSCLRLIFFERDLIRPFASIWHSQETAGIYENLMTIPGADIQDFILNCRYLKCYAISRCAVSCLRLKFS